ncbi:MAG: ATP-binding protein [Bacteroidia bacterium]|nr:ATP-binding protein [Bacteroidia bacterium]
MQKSIMQSCIIKIISLYLQKEYMESPFIFGKIVSGNAFINRANEIHRLKANLSARINTIIISPRRWGKSSLVKKTADKCKKNYKQFRFVFIDLFNIRNEQEFYEVLVRELLKSSSTKWEEWIKTGKEFIRRIMPVFSIGLNPEIDFSVNFDWKELARNVDEILELPDKIGKKKQLRFVICIDEFQKIAAYADSLSFQQKLRSHWQNQQNTTYCLYGSKRHVITELFKNQAMPFYKFGDLMFLQKIDETHWVKYITQTFERTNKKIEKNQAQYIIELIQNHPYHIQQLSHHVWINTKKTADRSVIDSSLDELLLFYNVLYAKEIESLSELQVNFLRALIHNEIQITSKEIVQKYRLGSPGNITRIKKALENKEIIDFYEIKQDFVDPLFELWCKRNLY